MQHELILPPLDSLKDFAKARELLKKVSAYQRELQQYLEENDELIAYDELDNREHVMFLFGELPAEQALPKDLRKWFAANCPNKQIWFFTSERFNGHGMTERISTGWMQQKCLTYKYYYTDNASGDNADEVRAQLEKRGVPARTELEASFVTQSESLLEETLLYLHYHLLNNFRNLVMECGEGEFLTTEED